MQKFVNLIINSTALTVVKAAEKFLTKNHKLVLTFTNFFEIF